MDSFIRQYQNKAIEWSAAFHLYPDKSYLMSAARTDNSTSTVSTTIAISGRHTIGSIHNHPNGTAFSPDDVYNLAKYNEKQGGYYTTTFVIDNEGRLYCLQVDDPAKVKAFNAGKDPVKQQFNQNRIAAELALKVPGLTNSEAYMYGLAYALEQADIGIKLLMREGNAFTQKKTVKNSNNSFTAQTCTY